LGGGVKVVGFSTSGYQSGITFNYDTEEKKNGGGGGNRANWGGLEGLALGVVLRKHWGVAWLVQTKKKEGERKRRGGSG